MRCKLALLTYEPVPESIKKTKQKKEKKVDSLQKTNFKTIVCKYWEKGECKYKEGCTFAHGDVEMRSIVTVANNRWKMLRN